MFYRVHADLLFEQTDEANDFYHDCHKALLKSQVINPGQDTEERATISLELCYHDEPNNKPCEILQSDEL